MVEAFRLHLDAEGPAAWRFAESALVHARIVLNFLCPPKERTEDYYGEQFVDGWEGILPQTELAAMLGGQQPWHVRQWLNRRLVHCSPTRSEQQEGGDWQATINGLADACRLFRDLLDEERRGWFRALDDL